ncbi:MAG: DUF6338 family protein [Candidatus Acidiferrales bacterium]
MPTSFHAVFVILLFLIPGFIARGVLSSIYPGSEPSEARLVLTAIALSCINYGLWSWLLVLVWKNAWYDNALPLALLTVLILFLSPVLFTLAVGSFMRTDAFRRLREAFGIRHPTPKSWDYFFGKGLPCWIIVTLKSGRIIGGYYGTNSFASSFPAEEDLYLEKLCDMTPDGRLNGITGFTLGGIIRMEDVQLLEFFEYVPEERDDAE